METAVDIDEFMNGVADRSPGEDEFHQAVHEVAESVLPYIAERDVHREARILERLIEPDRAIGFRVTWQDDDGAIQINRAWRVQFSNAIGPYKGGLRFHPSVNLSVLKFLGFEQIFKNSLTGLPMGGGKGGSDFDPKGRSDAEVMRFCQGMMAELHRHIGEDVDVPAGDIGVGAREIGYLFGQYRRIAGRWAGVLTGKGHGWGGSPLRTEATGYGAVYFLENMLARADESIEGKTAIVSGAGNVSLYAIEKLNEMGATVVTASDSDGYIHDPDGIAGDKLEWLRDLKENRRGRVSEYADEFDCEFHEGERPWDVECELALPCATQNELTGDDARTLIDNGVIAVVEGANMPTEIDGIEAFRDSGVLFGPGKAANAGGVAVSGMEQSQNAQRQTWPRYEVDRRLREVMARIHDRCVEYGRRDGGIDYVDGANIAGYARVAEALLRQGAV